MIPLRNIYTSLDIGTNSVKVVVCELYKNKLNLLAASEVKSKGIKKGLIIDGNKAYETIKDAIKEVSDMLRVTINKVIVTIPSYFAEYKLIKESVDIKDPDGMIEQSDIRELFNKLYSNTFESSLVNIIPIDFCTENGNFVKDPRLLRGRKLYNRSIAVTTPKKNIYSVATILEKLGIEIIDVSISGIGDMYALKNKDTDNKIGAIINIGSETTSISIYNKGVIVKSSVIGIGGKSIDNDLSYMYKISMQDSLKIKENIALAHKKFASVNDLYDIILEDGNILKINQFEVSEIVMSRIEEILSLGKKEIGILTDKKMEYVIATGGVSNMEYFEYVMNDIFGPIASVGNINLIGLRNNIYSTALGNMIFYINKQNMQGIKSTMIDLEDIDNLSSTKKNLVVSTETMIGKVFEHFFGE